MTNRSPGLAKAIERVGGIRALGRALGISGAAVSAWRDVPMKRVAAVAKLARLSERFIRPDFFKDAAE